MPSALATSVERDGRSAIVHLTGDLTVPTARTFYAQLQTLAKRRDVRTIVVDFSQVGRVDSSGVAAVSLVERFLQQHKKTLDLKELGDDHRAAFAMVPRTFEEPVSVEQPGALEQVGDAVVAGWNGTRALTAMVADTSRQAMFVVARKKRLPAGSVAAQIIEMGVGGIFVVALLSFLLGLTMGFQGVMQLERFGAGVFVADMISLSMVRELGPLMTAIILVGRTGAAIAAELGTMKVRSEIDALSTMGINPHRFLILPRLLALTIAGPALTLMSMFIGMFAGMLVTSVALDMPMGAYWQRVAEFVTIGDYGHGLLKSLVFAWIIATTSSHYGMRANGDPTSVGHATTRTVVVSILFIILVDAVFATVSTLVARS
jgi:phospholipid/cholesterol/gamma-HCH transport system permease protein